MTHLHDRSVHTVFVIRVDVGKVKEYCPTIADFVRFDIY